MVGLIVDMQIGCRRQAYGTGANISQTQNFCKNPVETILEVVDMSSYSLGCRMITFDEELSQEVYQTFAFGECITYDRKVTPLLKNRNFQSQGSILFHLFIHLQNLNRLAQFSFRAGFNKGLYKTTRPDHNTGSYVPHALREVQGILNVPC